MTSSSNAPLERGLDTMLLVYSILQGHPAASACEKFLLSQSGWFTSPLVLFETKAILTKVYGVGPANVTGKLMQLQAAPIAILDLDETGALAAFQLADLHGLDFTDASLLHLAQKNGARNLATEDQKLAQVCAQLGLTPESPLDAALRQQVAAWETANLAPKGLGRVLRRIHIWLSQIYPTAAKDFWSQTGGASHLP